MGTTLGTPHYTGMSTIHCHSNTIYCHSKDNMIGTPNGGADTVTMVATPACLKCADLDTILIGTPYGIDMDTND
jgi:hypothetical protein